jgi:hypothetical protein
LVDWIRYHSDAFPSVGDWIGKHPETVKFWGKAFDGVDLRDAKAATDEMAAGKLDEPKGYSSHPRVISKRARELGSARSSGLRVVDGQRVFGCHLCQDSGYVPVVDPVHYRKGTFRECYVLCTCGMGDQRAHARPIGGGKIRETPRYDKSQMLAMDLEIPQSELKQDFERWLGGGRVASLSAYEPAFDDFNEVG